MKPRPSIDCHQIQTFDHKTRPGCTGSHPGGVSPQQRTAWTHLGGPALGGSLGDASSGSFGCIRSTGTGNHLWGSPQALGHHADG